MIKEYQINVAAKTVNQADLASGWVLAVAATSKENTSYTVVIHTCSTQGGTNILDPYENIPDRNRVYRYNPSADNSKTENLMLTNNFEADLDTWFGSGNWATL